MNQQLPRHIGFIMDGNGRWAKEKRLPRKAGHREGVKAMERMVDACDKYNIRAVSFYAFSTENWKRPKDEIDAIFSMVRKLAVNGIDEYQKRNFKFTVMGDLSPIDDDVKNPIMNFVQQTKENTGLIVNIGLNYGGKSEIVHAANRAIESGLSISEKTIEQNLYTTALPDLDLLVRSGGEIRLSNFMLWQSAYAELYFTDVYWPDFTEETFSKILYDYTKRNRRFGAVKEGTEC